MIVHSIGGVISTKLGKDLTILLTTGSKVKVHVKTTSLRLGQRVQVCFNHETSEVRSIVAEGSCCSDPDAIEALPWKDNPHPDDFL